MPMVDVFKEDAFSLFSLTTAINLLPFVPARLGAMGLFKESGVTTTSVGFEENQGKLSLIPTAARGSMPTVKGGKKRRLRTFAVPHLPVNSAVLADDSQNVRAFGSETDLETVSSLVNEKLEVMKQDLEVTAEYHRVGGIQGMILDADGESIIYNLFDEFGLTETVVNFTFDSDEEVKLKALEVIRLMQVALGATPIGGIHAMCGDEFFDNLITCVAIKEAYNRWQDGQFFRDQQIGEGGFPFAGIVWENYRGKIGETDFIPPGDARFFPVGAPGLFIRNNAPAPFMETVNTIGKPFYAKQKMMDWDVGIELHAQANPLHMCTRPKCLIKGSLTEGSSSEE